MPNLWQLILTIAPVANTSSGNLIRGRRLLGQQYRGENADVCTYHSAFRIPRSIPHSTCFSAPAPAHPKQRRLVTGPVASYRSHPTHLFYVRCFRCFFTPSSGIPGRRGDARAKIHIKPSDRRERKQFPEEREGNVEGTCNNPRAFKAFIFSLRGWLQTQQQQCSISRRRS